MQKVGMGSSSGAGSAGVMVSSSSESSTPKIKSKQSLRTPKTAPRKKSSSQKALMGHKWFKGSPKSRSNQRISKKLLKSPIVEKTVQKPPTPVGVVEFDVDGSCDRVSVYDLIPCTEMDEDLMDSTPGATYNSDVNPDVVNSFSSTPGDKINKSSKLCKSKETPKSRGGSVKSSKSKSKTPNRLSNKNKSSKDLESRRKSPPLCKLPEACYEKIKNFDISFAPPLPVGYIRYMEIPQEELADEVEYDLDEEDNAWLHFVNDKRKEQNLHPVKYADMELLMDRLEKESYFQMQSTGIDQGALIDDDAVCCICMDGECQNSNAILFCDMCNLAVHQECYGVPYIPEGQWLCRRCLQSPSRAVDCALCPNKGGAFKQTDDGRWAHVVCAIWIPEVCFANTVFLEPIDSIGNIPAARWRLVCFICKQKGVGACIQCHKSNCYIAFHVTCAQQAGLCMKMDTVRESSSVSVKKTAYCDNHAPPESDFLKEGDGTPSPRQKMRQARKLLAEKRSAIPVLSIPTIPGERVTEISQTVSFTRKNQFVKRLMAYWKLKRQSRNGVPLLRRLQASSSLPHPTNRDTSAIADPNKAEESQAYYRYWLRLRQDLERARLLCELVRKREKVKKELIHLKCREVEIQLRPFSLFLLNVLEEIAVKDIQEIFAEPVDTSEVPDYFEVVDQPMDLSTIRDKINSFQYNNIDEFEADFNLMIGNCLNYNSKDTVFYRSAVRLRELGGIIIRHARRSIDAIGYDSTTGLHLPERKYIPVVLTDEEIIQKVDNLLNDESRFDKPFDKHMELLNDALDDTLALSHPATRKKKYNKVKHEQVRVRRLKHSKLNKLSSSSPLKEKYKKTVTKDNKDKNISNSLIQNKTSDLSDTDQVQSQQQSQNHFTRRNRAVRSRLSFSQSQSTAKNAPDSLTPPTTRARRTLGPGKRKREPSNPPLPQTLSPSPSPPPCSPPVLRASTTKLKAAQPDQSVTSGSGRSPPKKSRRVSSATSIDLQSSLIVTPAVTTTPIKSLSKNNANSRNTSSTPGSSDGKKHLSMSGSPKSGSTSRLAACLRDRDRNDEQVTCIGNRLRDRDSLSSDKASPFKAAATTITPSKSPSSISKGGGGIGKPPSATSSPSTTNRRDAVLFSKKVNSSPLFNDSHAANIIAHQTLSTSIKNPNSSSRIPSPQTVTTLNSSAKNKNIKKSTSSKRLTTWLNSNNNNNSESNTKIIAPAAPGDAEIEENKYKCSSSTSSPPRRNSTRGARNKKACSNLINNNTAMTNNNINNVMTLNNNRSLPPWNNNRNRSFYSEPVNSNCLDRNLSQSESSSVVSPWNHTNTLSSVALAKVNNSNLVASSDVNISSNNSNVRKRNSKKKNPTSSPANANSISTANVNNLDKIQVTTIMPASSSDHHNNYLINQYNNSSNYTPSGSSANLSNTGRIPSLSNSHARSNTTPSSNNHNNNSRHNAKADSFLVYRSGRDMDSNSEEDDNGPDKEEKVNANSDSDNDDDDDVRKDSSASASVSASDDDNDGSHDSISATSPRGDNDDSRDDSGSSSSSESSDSSDEGSCSSSATATTRSPSTNSNLKRSKKKNSINKRAAAPSSDVVINADDADSSSGSGSSSSGSGSDDSAESTESDSSGNGISNPNLNLINHTNTRGRQPQGQCRQRPTTRTRQVGNNAVNVNHKQDKKESSSRQTLSKISRKKTEEKVGVDSHSHDGSGLLLPDPLKAKGRNMKGEVVEDNDEDMEDEEGLVMERPSVRVNMTKVRLEPLDLVWAKCNELEGSWYPALIINPDMPLGFTQNDVPIPGPPQEVLLKRPRNSHENHFLVLCFDNKRTWEWISRNHLEPLGQDPKADKGHLMTRKSDKRSLGALRKAYEKALLHRNRVNGAIHGFPNIN